MGATVSNTPFQRNRADYLDDLLFGESCWLLTTKGIHNPMTASFNYLFEGTEYHLTLHEWLSGVRPHLLQEKKV